jgi:chromosome segregation ATPase
VAESLDFYVNVLSGSSSGLAAVSALQGLDSAAAKATSGIQSLEEQVASASKKLEAMGSTETIDALTSRLATARQQLDAIKSGKVPFSPGDYKRASDEVGKLGSQLDAAKTKQAAAIEAQKGKLDSLTGKLKEQQSAQAATANLNAAKRAQIVKGLDEQVSGLGRVLGKAQEAGGPGGALAG